MQKGLKYGLFLLSFLLITNVFAQEQPAAAAKPKPPQKKEEGPKPPTPEEQARELLISGESKKKQAKYDEAIADFDKALEIYIELYEVYVARASCYFLKLDFNSAMADYNRAIEVIETETEKIKTQAKIKRVLQDAAGEKLELDKLDKLMPILADAYYQRGNLKQFSDDISGGCEDLNKSKELGHLQADLKIAEFCGK